ncbi:MAG: flavodoxin family protein [Thermodesulfobacteriota bacterium]|nr:flavodoxin family protein [Thermodesulfobacteriota bacterium]
MKILAFMGSPRLRGLNAQLIERALEGAKERGAEVKRYDLIKCNIKYCIGCFKCIFENHDLPVGKCTLKDDMAAILEDYTQAEGYILSSPVYDVNITALMKTFIERKFPLYFKDKEDTITLPAARTPAHFLKKAALFITANARDEYREVMGTPSFEALEYDLMIEQVEIIERFYVGGAHVMTEERLSKIRDEAFSIGSRLVQSIEEARRGLA